mgnify:CR=1 FL=1
MILNTINLEVRGVVEKLSKRQEKPIFWYALRMTMVHGLILLTATFRVKSYM